MHILPDMVDEDAVTEVFWPDTYKQAIRRDVKRAMVTRLARSSDLKKVYAERFADDYDGFESFVDRIADMVVIGAERSADDAFDDIYTAFLTDSPLPQVRRYAVYYWPGSLPLALQRRVHGLVVADYSQERGYIRRYEDRYASAYGDFGEFINAVADLVVAGAVNGADDMLGQVYRSFLTPLPFPIARRHPRRLKGW